MILLLATILTLFSPKGGCEAECVKLLRSAKVSIHMQAYSFGSLPIANEAITAKARGVDVQIIFDKSWRAQMQRNNYPTVAQDLVIASPIISLIDGKHSIAHNKIMIIDGKIVETGSYNYTGQAETSNAENLNVFLTNEHKGAEFENNFALHKAHSVPTK